MRLVTYDAAKVKESNYGQTQIQVVDHGADDGG
jgi:hypothetical protein